jgi:AcrR family transcriptional regulator
MERKSVSVKPTRRYDSSGRKERARQTRETILDVAQSLFLRDGYGTTTVASVATAARVSVETVYKAFGGKPGLVRAIIERGLAGDSPVPAPERSDQIRDSEPDPTKIVMTWGRFTTEIAPRVAPTVMLARAAAATDPAIATLLDEIDAQRLSRMTLNARGLHDAGHLPANISVEDAADVLWTYSSPELYDLLVNRRGWSSQRYGQFIGEAMTAALLNPPGRTTKPAAESKTTPSRRP